MKKLTIILIAVMMSSSVFSQDGNLKKQFYLRLGASIPTWKYYGYNGKSDWSESTKRIGGLFEIGSIYMLNGIKLMDGMRLGINVDYLSVNMNRFTTGGNSYSENFAFIGSKIGPSFSYSPVKHLVFDAYGKFNPVWVASDFINYSDNSSSNEMFLGFMGIKYSVGLNVRYSVLMLGFEFNPGYAKLRYYNKDENKLTKTYMGSYKDQNSKKTPVPCMNFTLGLSL
jgi:hypothetical protein